MTPNTKMEHPEWMSFSEKKKRFEKVNTSNASLSSSSSTSSMVNKVDSGLVKQTSEETHSETVYTESKRFSYLAQNESETLRHNNQSPFDEHDEKDISVSNGNNHTSNSNGTKSSPVNDGFEQPKVFRTAKAERKYMDKMKEMGVHIDQQQYDNMTLSQRKALEAEKRREWRQARLKSLEDDSSVRVLVDSKNHDSFATTILEHDDVDEE